MIPRLPGWVWQRLLLEIGRPGFDFWSGLFFLFLHDRWYYLLGTMNMLWKRSKAQLPRSGALINYIHAMVDIGQTRGGLGDRNVPRT